MSSQEEIQNINKENDNRLANLRNILSGKRETPKQEDKVENIKTINAGNDERLAKLRNKLNTK